MKRKLVSLLLACMMLFTLLPVTAAAAEEEYTVTSGKELVQLLEELGEPTTRTVISTDVESITIADDLVIPRKVNLSFWDTDLVVDDDVELTISGSMSVSDLQINAGAEVTVAANGNLNYEEACLLFGDLTVARQGYITSGLTNNSSFEVYSTGSLLNCGTMWMWPHKPNGESIDLVIAEAGGTIDSSRGHILWNYSLGGIAEIDRFLAEMDERRAKHPDWLQNAKFQFWSEIAIDRDVTLPHHVSVTFLGETVINSGCTLTTNSVVQLDAPMTIKGTWVNNDHISLSASDWSNASLKLASGGKYSGGSIQVDIDMAPEEYTNLPWDVLPGFKESMFEEVLDETEYGSWYLLGENDSGLWFESQPDRSMTVKAGQTVKLTVVPRETTAHLSYQWQYRKPGGVWTDRAAYGPTLTFEAKSYHNGYQYRCIVNDGTTWSYSTPTTLTLSGAAAKPTVTTQPKDASVTAGEKAVFTVKATGTDLKYQWQYKAPNGTWKDTSFSGNKTATLTVTTKTTHDDYEYRCEITNAGGTVYSSPAELTVFGIISSPKRQTVAVGEKAKFTVKAAGDIESYQWYYRKNADSEWTKSSAASGKTATLSVTAKAYLDGYQYRCKVTDERGKTKNSSYATLVVEQPLAITSNPKRQTVEVGEKAKFTVKATGEDLTYQWYYCKPNTTEWLKSTASSGKTATLSVTAKSYLDGYRYRCRVTDGSGAYKTSSYATLVIEK